MSDTKFRPKAEWKISGDESGHINYRAVSNELVIAWALDKVTREPRYMDLAIKLDSHLLNTFVIRCLKIDRAHPTVS